MMCFLFGVLFLATLLFLIAPLYKKRTDNQDSENQGPTTMVAMVLFSALIFGSLGVYSLIGRSDLAHRPKAQPAVLSPQQALSQNATPQHDNEMSIEQLVGGLEEKLKENPNNPQGWVLYARSLMTLQRYDEAFTAYERVLSLTENNPNIVEELRSAKEFAAQQIAGATRQSQDVQSQTSGPTQEDIAAASQMTQSDRDAMIQGMVDGLSAKLVEDPNDPNQWVRLLRARAVLKQGEQAQIEIARMKNTFAEQPQTITRILQSSGWDK